MYVQYKDFIRYDRQSEGWRSIVDTPPFPVDKVPFRPKYIFNDWQPVVYDIPHRIDWIVPVLPVVSFNPRLLPSRFGYIYDIPNIHTYTIPRRIDWISSSLFNVATLPYRPRYIFNVNPFDFKYDEPRERVFFSAPVVFDSSLLPYDARRRYMVNSYESLYTVPKFDIGWINSVFPPIASSIVEYVITHRVRRRI